MTARCAVCGFENEVEAAAHMQAAEPPDFDTRPGEPLRSTISTWVACCLSCGYCADDLTRAHSKATELVQTDAYRAILDEPELPRKAREFLAYACLLDKLHQYSDAGWTALHAAWVCDDTQNLFAARHCREQTIEYWKRGKHAGQPFGDDMSSEYALVSDLHRRMGQFELAMVTCSEALDFEDLPPVIEAVLRRQKTLIEGRDTASHSVRELLVAT